QAGGNGPDVTVRLAILRSRFYDKLIVAAVEVAYSRPYYVFADGNTIPPANWLWVESRGGRGGAGTSGQNGGDGAAGQAGCPPQPGGPGGSGGNGGPGGSGGRSGAQRLRGRARSAAADRHPPDPRAVRPEYRAGARGAARAGGRTAPPPVTAARG